MWQFARAVEGMGAACRALDIPITGGNVSLYNETDGRAVLPTPVLGVVGVIDDADTVLGQMRDLGLAATEFGPVGFLPEEPRAKAEKLETFGLRAVGGFLPVLLHDPEHDPWPEVDAFVDGEKLLAWATDLATGASAAGVELELTSGARATTDELGLAVLELPQAFTGAQVLLARRGADLALLFAATDVDQLAERAGLVREQLAATDFAQRARACARILVREGVDVVGLQEVTRWATAPVLPDGRLGPEQPVAAAAGCRCGRHESRGHRRPSPRPRLAAHRPARTCRRQRAARPRGPTTWRPLAGKALDCLALPPLVAMIRRLQSLRFGLWRSAGSAAGRGLPAPAHSRSFRNFEGPRRPTMSRKRAGSGVAR